LDFIGAHCPQFPVIKNGFVTDTSRDYYFGDEARVQCYKGYKLTGSNIIKCGVGQEFLNPPKCEGEDLACLSYIKWRQCIFLRSLHTSLFTGHGTNVTDHHKILQIVRCMNIIKYDADLNVPDFSSDLKFEQKYIIFAG